MSTGSNLYKFECSDAPADPNAKIPKKNKLPFEEGEDYKKIWIGADEMIDKITED